jgi:hypothetical protein
MDFKRSDFRVEHLGCGRHFELNRGQFLAPVTAPMRTGVNIACSTTTLTLRVDRA